VSIWIGRTEGERCDVYGLFDCVDRIALQITTEPVREREREKESWVYGARGTTAICILFFLLLMTRLPEGGGEPLETLIKTVARGGAGGLDVPGTLSQTVETKLVCDLSSIHGIRQILLVGENQQNGIPQLVLVQHALELLSGLDDTVAIIAVDDEDNSLGVLEIMSPQRSDFVLSTDVPHGKLDVLVLDRLDVEADSGDGGDDFTELELVQNRGLSGSVESDHQNSHLLLPPQLIEEL